MGLRVNNPLRSFRKHQPDVNALSAQLDGMLDPRASANLDVHVSSCDACRAQLYGLRTTRAPASIPKAEGPRRFRLRVADTVPVTLPLAHAALGARDRRVRRPCLAVVVCASPYSAGGSTARRRRQSQRNSGAIASAPRPTAALDSAGAALEAGSGMAADATSALAPSVGDTPPSAGEVASTQGSRNPPAEL